MEDDERKRPTDKRASRLVPSVKINRGAVRVGVREMAGENGIEQKTIGCLRIFIAFLLIVATVTSAILTWSILGDAESEEFEKELNVIAEDLNILSEQRVLDLLSQYRSLSSAISGLAINSQAQWPYFTGDSSSFPIMATSIMRRTGAHVVSYAPIVHNLTERVEWARYSQANQKWIKDGVEMEKRINRALESRRRLQGHDHHQEVGEIPDIFPDIYRLSQGEKVPDDGPGPFLPSWQMVAAPREPSLINYNLLSDSHIKDVFDAVIQKNSPVMTDLLQYALQEWNSLLDNSQHAQASPFSMFLLPVFRSVQSQEIVAIIMIDVNWSSLFSLGSDEEAPPVHVVVDDGCKKKFTFQVSGPTVDFLGYGDYHDTAHEVHERSFPFTSELPTIHLSGADCSYSIRLYPTRDFWEAYHTNNPSLAAGIIVGVFLLTVGILLLYDCVMRMRQRRIDRDAHRSEQLLSVLYPKNVRDRLFMEDGSTRDKANRNQSLVTTGAKSQLKKFGSASQSNTSHSFDASKPIADLFMDATVFFADIAGFTAWSSVREPAQVFTLLESIFCSFDDIAKRRNVFKVETIGDCYVAVTGLPEPTKDHASIMAFFARECLNKFNHLVGTLEKKLGPDTSDLGLRVGMHSGPVTAGVLRGDKSRFQLFGDTVNTCSRIESTGKRNRIQVSAETADLLKKAGKAHLLEQRKRMVEAKGKGRLKTFWLLTVEEEQRRGQKIRSGNRPGFAKKFSPTLRKKSILEVLSPRSKKQTTGSSRLHQAEKQLSPKIRRLCEWNVDTLLRHLQQIVTARNASKQCKHACDGGITNLREQEEKLSKRRSTLDEVVEIIPLPGFDPETFNRNQDQNDVDLPEVVVNQVKLFVASIALMYRDNPFHNFEHASHVAMSVSKLLFRIVAADDLHENTDDATALKSLEDFGWSIHDHTYGITSDPMTQFTVILAALIHDADHLGVSNSQLIQEGHELADVFQKKSIAEQNSIAKAWDLLMDPRFVDFRHTIYTDEFELGRFRQLIANTVLATDIMDKELQTLRRNRWDAAFKSNPAALEGTKDNVNRKATIVIEHLIQASDVAHTMQHWHVYCKWNERLFHELVVAYKAGRLNFNPAEKWYEGELGFFDNYVIPLAKKLKDCGVFGVSSDEYLMYALDNRREFEEKGREFVAELEDRYIRGGEGVQKSSRHLPEMVPL